MHFEGRHAEALLMCTFPLLLCVHPHTTSLKPLSPVVTKKGVRVQKGVLIDVYKLMYIISQLAFIHSRFDNNNNNNNMLQLVVPNRIAACHFIVR